MEYKHSLFWPYQSKKIRKAVNETLKTRWQGQGPKVDLFEQKIEEKFGRKYAVSVNSGTSALELAYDLTNLQVGDEVITTVLTCTATNIPLLRRGVKLVFADINPDTLCIDWYDVWKKVTNKTKAIIVVSLGGISPECPKDIEIHGIPVIHDAAQGIGLTSGDYCIYSFQAIKHFTTGDGGMLFTPNEETYKKAKLLRWFGIDRERKRSYDWQAYKNREMTFDIELPGYKYQMNDIAASMGIAGLDDYDQILNHRRTIFDLYKNELDGWQGIKMIDGSKNVYWLATLLVDDRDNFAEMMKNRGIETNLVQIRNDVFQIFGGKKLDLPNINSIEDRYISIPLHHGISVEDAHYIIQCIKGGW